MHLTLFTAFLLCEEARTNLSHATGQIQRGDSITECSFAARLCRLLKWVYCRIWFLSEVCLSEGCFVEQFKMNLEQRVLSRDELHQEWCWMKQGANSKIGRLSWQEKEQALTVALTKQDLYLTKISSSRIIKRNQNMHTIL